MILSSPDPAADPFVATAVLGLQLASYAVEAELVGDDRLPPLLEDAHALAAWRGRWLMAWDGVELVGAVAWTGVGDHVDLAKVMVSPPAMRRGVATAMLSRVLSATDGRDVVVSTGRDNAPAVSFYARHGFVREADEHVPPGIWTTRFRLARG
ncbi:GNAT family N-acetyltransferase [Aeromicrobium fastidiosum]|uniref:GNAT family N-acetyltransferase n=1 Tax=Aeromicrobium fastidiosum TaxID=52699 RepID=A0A641ALW8_9ACTN|nr:GNAT family N-acetyltransferase [Aeromicrobium fastidiosum]KAA1378113.1 GNAT family N-acetyltransferase [Aeromicrobium fastidiosum]MBP2389090.1 GNAT superfamily N-acetyltransferase [Aeromicrobium fastidiosum]